MKHEDQAKSIFIKHNGDYYSMSRENEFDKYKSFFILKEVENDWIKELRLKMYDKIDEHLNDTQLLSTYFYEIVNTIINFPDTSAINILIEKYHFLMDKVDSFIQLRLTESMKLIYLKINKRFGFRTNKMFRDLKKMLIFNLLEIQNSNISFSQESISSLKPLVELNEKYLKLRINNNIKEIG